MAKILKFKCERCGQRIAVQPRHLNKLINCPECGQATHPLAEQIVSARAAVETATAGGGKRTAARRGGTTGAPGTATDRACANCGDAIGKLQKELKWENEVVCKTCHKRLSNEATKSGAPAVVEDAAPKKSRRGGGWRSKSTKKNAPVTADARRVAAPDAANTPHPAQAIHAVGGPLTLSVDARPLAGGANHLPAAENLRVIPMTLGTTWATVRGRLLALLIVVCILAAAVYGAMSLLRDIAGLVAGVAFVMLAAVATWLLLRATLQAGKRFVAARMAAHASAAAAAGNASPGDADLVKALPQQK